MKQSTSLHVAIVMDGNGRWATRRGLPRAAGHRAGAEAVRRVVKIAPGCGIGALTLYAFSSDNWTRPSPEVSMLMRLFARYLRSETAELATQGIKLTIIGRRDRLPASLAAAIRGADAATAAGTRRAAGGRLPPPLGAATRGAEAATPAGARLELRIAMDYSARPAIRAGDVL